MSETVSETRTLGCARWNSQSRSGTTEPPGPVEAPISSVAGELALAGVGDLLQQLLLEREHALRAAVEPEARLGRLDAPARAVEQAPAEPLLERADLKAHCRLRDAELLGGVREALLLDDGAE